MIVVIMIIAIVIINIISSSSVVATLVQVAMQLIITITHMSINHNNCSIDNRKMITTIIL